MSLPNKKHQADFESYCRSRASQWIKILEQNNFIIYQEPFPQPEEITDRQACYIDSYSWRIGANHKHFDNLELILEETWNIGGDEEGFHTTDSRWYIESIKWEALHDAKTEDINHNELRTERYEVERENTKHPVVHYHPLGKEEAVHEEYDIEKFENNNIKNWVEGVEQNHLTILALYNL